MQRCSVCDKGPIVGRSIARRGLAKKTGGIGKKTTGISRRRFMPNLQRVKAISSNGTVRRILVCVSCLAARKITKATGHRKRALEKASA